MIHESEDEPAYHRDPYRRSLSVWVDAVGRDEKHGPYVVLSDTLCHPHGGGQKGDRATLRLTAEEAATAGCARDLPVIDTRREGSRILHILPPETEPGSLETAIAGIREVTLDLEWEFRFRQMRLHSTAHLLHCFVERIVGRPLDDPQVSDLRPEFGLNRYAQRDLLNPEQLEEAVAALNAFTAEGHAIRTTPDESKPGFRTWQCEGWTIPCGGTHPASTAEIGPVSASLSLKRGRTSMTFSVC